MDEAAALEIHVHQHQMRLPGCQRRERLGRARGGVRVSYAPCCSVSLTSSVIERLIQHQEHRARGHAAAIVWPVASGVRLERRSGHEKYEQPRQSAEHRIERYRTLEMTLYTIGTVCSEAW